MSIMYEGGNPYYDQKEWIKQQESLIKAKKRKQFYFDVQLSAIVGAFLSSPFIEHKNVLAFGASFIIITFLVYLLTKQK